MSAADGDELMRAALGAAAHELMQDPRPLVRLREIHLRDALVRALTLRCPLNIECERGLALSAFRGVGPFDLLFERGPGGDPVWVAETKWSYTARDKIFEAAWDAVKLALAQDEHGVTRGWLVTAAPDPAWARTECADLFADGSVAVHELWSRPLTPAGSNGGETVGRDCEFGGRGNMFTRAPERLRIEEVGAATLRRSGEQWTLKAAAVSPQGLWIEDFAPPPRFPRPINQAWLDREVPSMDQETFQPLLDLLRQRRWTEAELNARVLPLRSPPAGSGS